MIDRVDDVLSTVRWAAFEHEVQKAAGTVEGAHNFHPVVVQPPQAKRAKFPFEGFIDFQGLKIDVENKKGNYRRGKDKVGHAWAIKMTAHYGEIRGTEGVDGDKLDVYVGPNHDSSLVVAIRQHRPDTGAYDEDKVMVGWDTVEEAVAAYKKQYDRPGFYQEGDYKAMPIGEFWRWVHDRGNRGKKVAFAGVPEQLKTAGFGAGALAGGAAGSLIGAASAEKGHRLRGAATGGILGGVLGGAAGHVSGPLASRAPHSVPAAHAPPGNAAAAVRETAHVPAAVKAPVPHAGGVKSPYHTPNWNGDVRAQQAAEGFSPRAHGLAHKQVGAEHHAVPTRYDGWVSAEHFDTHDGSQLLRDHTVKHVLKPAVFHAEGPHAGKLKSKGVIQYEDHNVAKIATAFGVLATMKTAADLPDIIRAPLRHEIREFALHPHLQKGLGVAALAGGLYGGYKYHQRATSREMETGEPSTGKHMVEGAAAGAVSGGILGGLGAHKAKGVLSHVRDATAPAAARVGRLVGNLRAEGRSMEEIQHILKQPGLSEQVQAARVGYGAHLLHGKIHTGKAALVGAAGLGLLGAGLAGIHAHRNADTLRADIRAAQRAEQRARLSEVKTAGVLEKLALSKEKIERALSNRVGRVADMKVGDPNSGKLLARTDSQMQNVRNMQGGGAAAVAPVRPGVVPVAPRSPGMMPRPTIKMPAPPPQAPGILSEMGNAVKGSLKGVGATIGSHLAPHRGKLLLGAAALAVGGGMVAKNKMQKTDPPHYAPPRPTVQVAPSPWSKDAGVLSKLAGELPGVGDEAERPKVPGLKTPRLATPRLNPDRGKHIPTNPFRGNWQKMGTATAVMHEAGEVARKLTDAIPEKVKHGILGAGLVGAGAWGLKATADQAINPHPEGVGLGAGARAGQKVLTLGLSRAGSGPVQY